MIVHTRSPWLCVFKVCSNGGYDTLHACILRESAFSANVFVNREALECLFTAKIFCYRSCGFDIQGHS